MASGASRGGRLAEQAGQATRLACGISSLLRLPRLPWAGAAGGATAGLWRAAAHKQARPGAVEATRCTGSGSGSRRWGVLWLCLAVGTALIICCSPALNQAAKVRIRGKPSRCVGAALAGANAAHGARAVAGAVGRTVHLHGSRGWDTAEVVYQTLRGGFLEDVHCTASSLLNQQTNATSDEDSPPRFTLPASSPGASARSGHRLPSGRQAQPQQVAPQPAGSCGACHQAAPRASWLAALGAEPAGPGPQSCLPCPPQRLMFPSQLQTGEPPLWRPARRQPAAHG